MLAALLAAAALAAAPVRGPRAKALSLDLETRLDEAARRWREEHDKMLATGQAILLLEPSQRAPLMKRLDEHQRAARPLIVEMTALTRRLQRYRETAELPETIEDLADIERFLEDPWAQMPSDADPINKITKVKELPLDVVELVKELESYGRPAPQALPPPAARPVARREEPRPMPRLERDAGRGKPRTDPVPGLVELLGSEPARQRALAADMLGSLGPEAKPAAPRLREALGDADARVRASAALALGRAGAVDAADDLRVLLKDPSAEVRRSAKRALEELGGSGP